MGQANEPVTLSVLPPAFIPLFAQNVREQPLGWPQVRVR